jgi:hypothetical protein
VAVLHVTTARIQPGRLEDWLEMTRRSVKVVSRHGPHMRVARGTLGAEGYGTTVFSTEHANLEAVGAFLDELAADGEVAAILNEANGPHSPVQLVSEFLVQEIPLGRPQGEPGRVIAVHTARAKPGRTA